MSKDKFHSRIQSLFADIDHLASNPPHELDAMRRELENLRARVVELESQFLATLSKNSVNPAAVEPPQSTPPRPAAPILYEKEQIAYAFSGDHIEPLPAPALANLETKPVVRLPLVGGGQPIGAVLVEPAPERQWGQEEAQLAEAIARQVSLQIQNLRLLESAERARAEAQAATRRFAHESWQAFLDAIHQSERIGYLYDQSGVQPFTEPSPANADFQQTVSALDEHIGKLYLKADPQRPLTEEDKALVAAVAQQLGQQVENLRLLADASRARAEAEEAIRQLTRETWQQYVEQKQESAEGTGFLYNGNEVLPLKETSPAAEVTFVQPLTVRGEPIGELAVAGKEIPPESADLMAAIAAQASLHLETLRLNEELRKRAAELQELDRLKSSFLANMSHELRTPLNSILGFSDVMLEGIDGPLTEYMENDLRLIQKNGQHLLHLINDVLDMAKIESGRMNLHPEKFKVHDMLESAISITSTLANAKNLALYIDPDSEKELEIIADHTRINQVMINLINNSIKFTETGQISLHARALDSDKILITVRDTGIGIPADHLETIFQEFSQVDTSTTRKVGGTGLGLPISRRLVEMHGGRLWVESAGIPGQGSTFYVELPVEAKITEPIDKTAK
jgi:signal transduction histidine kinase